MQQNIFTRFFLGCNLWVILLTLFGIVMLMPIVSIIVLSLTPAENIWPHLLSTVLPVYIQTTLLLFLFVGVLSTVIGTLTAWLVTMYTFPGQRYFSWMLLLPLAMPTYVLAYTYTDLLEYTGPVQLFLRDIFQYTGTDVFPIRSMAGASIIMSFVLYPYIYITARAGFLEISPSMLESSKLFNRSNLYTFFHVALPLTRPAIIAGLTLVLLEVLNDFGTVDYFALKTFSIGVYDVWFNMGNLAGAAQIAFVALLFVFLLIFIEKHVRRKQRFYQTNNYFTSYEKEQLVGKKAWLAFGLCFIPVLVGFIIPTITLAVYSFNYFEQSWTADFRHYIANSLLLAISAAVLTVLLALVLVYSRWIYDNKLTHAITRLSVTGYALPGIVLAFGLLYPLTRIDHWLNSIFNDSLGLLLSGTVFILLFAYVVRFITIAIGSIESSFSKITPSMDMTARTLGYSRRQILFKFHLPLLKTGIFTVLILVFVDTMKELPTTLFLRPFNFDTLATHVYQFASDERLEECALGALIIVISGVLPIILLNRSLTKSRDISPS